MFDDLVRRHAWADDETQVPALTISGVVGVEDQRVTRIFGGELITARWMSFAEAAERPADPASGTQVIQVVAAGRDKVVVLEHAAGHGALPELARRASAGGAEFCSVSWTARGAFQVLHAVDGRVDALFDPVDFAYYPEEDPAPPPVPAHLPEWAADVRFRLETVGATSLALFERLLDLWVDPAWLLIPLRTVSVPAAGALFPDAFARLAVEAV